MCLHQSCTFDSSISNESKNHCLSTYIVQVIHNVPDSSQIGSKGKNTDFAPSFVGPSQLHLGFNVQVGNLKMSSINVILHGWGRDTRSCKWISPLDKVSYTSQTISQSSKNKKEPSHSSNIKPQTKNISLYKQN